MSDASLASIYNRLNGAPRYHPFSAKTFADWASEAGDTVQISRDGTTYAAPVHKQSLVWRGKHMINMESTGGKERPPIERVSNHKEVATSAGISSSRGYGGGAGKALQALQYDFYDEEGIYQSQMYMDEQRFTTIFAKTGLDSLGQEETLMTRIQQTAEGITLEAARASSAEGEISSRITQTASEIRAEVSAGQSELWSEVLQTATFISSEVHDTLCDFYTFIIQTASSIVIRTGDGTKTFHDSTAPTGTAEDPLVEGDIWFKGTGQFRWEDTDGKRWLDDTGFDWSTLKSTESYRYEGGAWQKISDEKGLLQDTKFEQTKEHIDMVAGRVDVVDGQLQSYRAEFSVEADRIKSHVAEQVSGMYSDITQTAEMIRSEVSAENGSLRSEIIQTATMIYSHVEDVNNGLHSEILQTATMIYAHVEEVNNGLESYIAQTATSITIAVNNSKSDIYSKISVNAGNINLKVSKDGVISSINQTSESIKISAGKIQLEGSVFATALSTALANLSSAHINKLYIDTNCYLPNGLSLPANGVWQISLSNEGNTYTLKEKKLNGDESVIGTFSRAIASWTMGWSGGTFTAKANPQNQSAGTTIVQGTALWDGYQATVPINAYDTDNPSYQYYTGRSILVDASSAYYAGIDYANAQYSYVGRRELGYMDHGQFESVGTHTWYYKP